MTFDINSIFRINNGYNGINISTNANNGNNGNIGGIGAIGTIILSNSMFLSLLNRGFSEEDNGINNANIEDIDINIGTI